jgi:hypothetical protein
MGRYTEAEIKFAGEPKYETITDDSGNTKQVRIEKTPEEFIAALDRIDMAKNRSQTQDNSGISILTNFGSGRSEQNQPAYSAPALPQPTPAAAKKPVTPKAPAGKKERSLPMDKIKNFSKKQLKEAASFARQAGEPENAAILERMAEVKK